VASAFATIPGPVARQIEKGMQMETSKQIARLTRIAAAVLLVATVAACANKDLQPDGANWGRGPATPGSQRDFAQNVGDIVYFTTDSTDLTPEGQQTLTSQARWLQQYSQYTITIEGHADERGTREYNIALGARRATAVREFLARHGVSGQRVRTISFGKERPVAVCNDISCWSQNRRAQTVLNNRAGT
jgi:peptidoglycan-associated lipoprotein